MPEMIIRYLHCAERLVAPREDLLRLPSFVPRKSGSYRSPIGTPFRHPSLSRITQLPRRLESGTLSGSYNNRGTDQQWKVAKASSL
jgi:hypothetical protein